ncbi:MAG: 50S ribosomal protein L19e [Candidatus Thermoplasmatota archaeon]|nr:50S ribosomal protein L19e [archaeon]MBU3902253.1 50S ribosomal protein L19e [Candidatus Thermoplasmatota archaeon]MCG2825919.1 50S ribosomal protein L19e [Thermoplasmatales archaeon]
MNLSNQKRMAASILKCGINRVWMDPDRAEDATEAVTRNDIRGLINSGVIKALRKKGISKGRIRKRKMQKKKGRRKGIGSRGGTTYARLPKKRRWIQKIRPQRKMLKELRDKGEIDKKTYRKLYRHASGGMFKSKAHLKSHLGVK